MALRSTILAINILDSMKNSITPPPLEKNIEKNSQYKPAKGYEKISPPLPKSQIREY